MEVEKLSGIIDRGVALRSVEPNIYSLYPAGKNTNVYDESFGTLYDIVACNPLYNRLMWGYSITKFASLARDALTSSKKGYVLDLGCGSLAFTAEIYSKYSDRPVVMVDQSLKMLKTAKTRLIRLNGKIPDNMVFLHADALQLPFRPDIFNTIISLNLLHCLYEIKKLLADLTNFLSEEGGMYFTTLITANRLADRYLKVLANAGKLVPRNIDELNVIFGQLGLLIKYDIEGNMAFVYCGSNAKERGINET